MTALSWSFVSRVYVWRWETGKEWTRVKSCFWCWRVCFFVCLFDVRLMCWKLYLSTLHSGVPEVLVQSYATIFHIYATKITTGFSKHCGRIHKMLSWFVSREWPQTTHARASTHGLSAVLNAVCVFFSVLFQISIFEICQILEVRFLPTAVFIFELSIFPRLFHVTGIVRVCFSHFQVREPVRCWSYTIFCPVRGWSLKFFFLAG